MTSLGMNGIRRGKPVRTTVSRRDTPRAGDLVNRNFTAGGPNRTWVADFTYARTWAGFVYVAFILDVYAQRIVAWHAATDKRTELVLTPLRIALWQRDRDGHPVQPGQLIHHADAGSQGGLMRSSQHLYLEVCAWDDHGDGLRLGRAGRRCGRRDGRGSINARLSRRSGGTSPEASRARTRRRPAACRIRWGRGGFVRVAACHPSVWFLGRDVTCRSRSVRRSRC